MRTTAPPPAPAKVPPPKATVHKPAEETKADSAKQAISPPVTPLPKPHERHLGHGKEHGMKEIEFPKADDIKTFSDLAKAMGGTTAGGRDVGKALEVLQAMKADKKCFTVLTLSGNATPLSPLIGDLIDAGLVHCVVSTGSICTHSFSAERGRPMFQIDDPEAVDDNWFYAKGYNRIYDCVELEESLSEGFDTLRKLLDTMEPGTLIASADVTELIGRHLNEKFPKENGILHAAQRNNVPVFIPAFSDCELGLDFYAINKLREREGKEPFMYDAFGDWERYADLIKEHKDSCGIITLGGGVVRNWSQQVGPSFDILTEYKIEPKSLIMRFKYGVRICTAPGTEGGLSGCSYCLHGDTLIETPRDLKLHPHGVPIRELVGKSGFPVYSYDREKKRIVLSNASAVFPSGKKHLYKVKYFWTSKGNATKRSKRCTGEVIASADHQFLMRDGTYKKLSDLKRADRLMPFNASYRQNGYAQAVYRHIHTNGSYLIPGITEETVRDALVRNRMFVQKAARDIGVSDKVFYHRMALYGIPFPQQREANHVVESVEYWGEDDTFDMTVEGTHNFAANSIILKNSEGRSWGKFWPGKDEGGSKNDIVGMNAEICGDFTLCFPLLAACWLEDSADNKKDSTHGDRTDHTAAD